MTQLNFQLDSCAVHPNKGSDKESRHSIFKAIISASISMANCYSKLDVSVLPSGVNMIAHLSNKYNCPLHLAALVLQPSDTAMAGFPAGNTSKPIKFKCVQLHVIQWNTSSCLLGRCYHIHIFLCFSFTDISSGRELHGGDRMVSASD